MSPLHRSTELAPYGNSSVAKPVYTGIEKWVMKRDTGYKNTPYNRNKSWQYNGNTWCHPCTAQRIYYHMVLLALKTSIYGNREMGDEMRYRLQKYSLQSQYNLRQLCRLQSRFLFVKWFLYMIVYARWKRRILFICFHFKTFKHFMKRNITHI